MLDATTSNKSPSVLVVATMWWPLSARLAMAFLRQGFRVSAASHKGHPLRFVNGISTHYRYGGFHALADLRRAIERERPTLVVPCDDGAVWQLHSLYEQVPALRPLLEFSLGAPETYSILRSRAFMLQMAAELGIRTPVTRAIHSQEDLLAAGVSTPAVLKLDGTCAGNGVRMVASREEAAAAFRELATPISRPSAWKQLLIDRDPSPLCALRGRQAPSVTIQEFIAGRPANAMLACRQGRILGMTIVEVVAARGATGAATVVRVIENAEISAAAHLLAERLQLTGFHGLDFLLQQGTGAAFLIELNPRATQLGHLRLPGRGDLVGALCSALRPNREPVSEDSIEGNIVAFFPQALSSNPTSPYLTAGYHDIPMEQPRLYRELLRTPWPDRRPLARAYHLLRPRKREVEAVFDLARSEPASQADPPLSPNTNHCVLPVPAAASYQPTREQ